MSDVPLTIARRKPRILAVSIAYRLMSAARKVLPARVLLRWVLIGEWLLRRVGYELAIAVYGYDYMDQAHGATDEMYGEFLRSSDVVVDAGCGGGRTVRRLAPLAAKVIGLDSDPVVIARAVEAGVPATAEFRVHDVTQPLPRCDVVVMTHVLEHVDDPEALLRGLCSDRIIVEVPDAGGDLLLLARQRLGTPWWGDDDHVREFTVETLRTTLARGGWKPVSEVSRGSTITMFCERDEPTRI